MEDISAIAMVLIVIIVIGIRAIQRYKPEYVAGGQIDEQDRSGWTYSYARQEKPEFIDVNTEKRYVVYRYRKIGSSPSIYEVEFKTVIPVTSSVKEEIFPVTFREGVNDPWPVHCIDTAIPNTPGAWHFSEKGQIDPKLPGAARSVEAKYQNMLEVERKTKRRVEQDAAAEVDHDVSLMGRHLRPQAGTPRTRGD